MVLHSILDQRELNYILKRVEVKRDDYLGESQLIQLTDDICQHIKKNHLLNDIDYQDMFDNVLLYILSNKPQEEVCLEDKFTNSDFKNWVNCIFKRRIFS
ncbi:MAG: hypothetical protein ACRCZ0_10950 [Cetobacterium sp.]